MRMLVLGLLTLAGAAANRVALWCLSAAQRWAPAPEAPTPTPATDERAGEAGAEPADRSKPWVLRELTERYFVQPIARRDDGAIVTDGLIECVTAEAAVQSAAQLAR